MAEYNSSFTGPQIDDAVAKRHEHSNKPTLDKVTEVGNVPKWDGGDWPNSSVDLTQVDYPQIYRVGNPEHIDNLHKIFSHAQSAGIMHGCVLTDNGDGTVNIGVGYALLRSTDNPHTPLYAIEVTAQNNITLTDDSTNYIYLDWSAGTPTFAVSTSIVAFNCIDKCIAYSVHRTGNTLNIIDAREQNIDAGRKVRQLFLEFDRFIHVGTGTRLGAAGLALTVTTGKFYFMLEQLPHDAFDTTVAGTDYRNVFKLHYRDGFGGWTQVSNSKTINTDTYDIGTGTPTTLGNNRYGVTWVYIVQNEPSSLHCVMGQQEYPDSASANSAQPPAEIPSLITGHGSLIGFVVYVKGATSFANVLSAFSMTFSGSAATNHNSLPGLQGGSVNEYYHLTESQQIGLTAGTNTTLHRHANATTEVDGYLSAADKIKINSMIEEAPQDGYAYVRVNGAWERLTWGTE